MPRFVIVGADGDLVEAGNPVPIASSIRAHRDALVADGWEVPEIDPVFRIRNQHHSFTDVYAAGLYVYLWADVMVSEVMEAFTTAPGSLCDAAVAARWRNAMLSVGNSVPGRQAFRDFCGRDPDPRALLRRFALT